MGLGVCGRELGWLPPPFSPLGVAVGGASLLKVRPFTLVSASRSSNGSVSALHKRLMIYVTEIGFIDSRRGKF